MSEGALVVPVAEEADKKEMPPLILVKSDGAVLYGTTDLATIVDRVQEHDPDLILYIVDQRQHGHFEQVFRAARKAGLNGKAELEHAGFGTMNGPDGKPFKTRAGGVMKLYDLIAMATRGSAEAPRRSGPRRATIRKPSAPRSRARSASRRSNSPISSNHRVSDYIFDLARFTRFEGKTGPYLQYAAVRIQSILRKADGRGLIPPIAPSVHHGGRTRSDPAIAGAARCDGRRPRPSARPMCCATTSSSWRRHSAASMPSITSCPKQDAACARPGWACAG